jgi:hypothetical protein
MDCRETRTLLTAFHDGELPAVERVRVEGHLRGCPECATLLAGLARIDQAAGVPDPGPAYWDRFNARVADRIAREADGPGVKVLRPKGGWVRRPLRYLVPAAAAAALVVAVVRFGGMTPGTPAPTAPPAVGERAAPDAEGGRIAKAEPEPRAAKKAEDAAVLRHVLPPVPDKERFAAAAREERAGRTARSLPEGSAEVTRDRAAAPAAGAPSPQVPERHAGGEAKSASGDGGAKESATDGQGRPGAGAGGDATGSVAPAGSPCDAARALAERERIREAEGAQRACLAGDLDAPSREKGLVFLAELLDRQTRFADADAVIAEVVRRYPQSRPLDRYRQQRPVVQKRSQTAPGLR